ncbi:hypothetical protein [Sediminicoccus rosea]|uniref:Transposase n=1 Tax=Sediminicoccus rosea TaxID=1225128 RepID=A0ABZ0PJL6_9PROT|nr:hypothetical protein [Sediminicoccus rosea]WPB85587.1 hypothetical protein R9Z33_01640 [Sediminicoccus rosea]
MSVTQLGSRAGLDESGRNAAGAAQLTSRPAHLSRGEAKRAERAPGV